MVYVLCAKSNCNEEVFFEVHRVFPDIGPLRRFCGNNLKIKNLNHDQLKRLLAGDQTQLGRWTTQISCEKNGFPLDQEKVWVLKAINTKNGKVDIKAYADRPTWAQCTKFDKHYRLGGHLFEIDNVIELMTKRIVECQHMVFSVEQHTII